LGAEFQPAFRNPIPIDLKVYAAVYLNKTDHTSPSGETIPISDGQYGVFFQLEKKGPQVRAFRGADEKDVTVLQVFQAADATNEDLPSLDGLSVEDIPIRSEWVVAQDVDAEGTILGAEGLGRPFDEFGEVINKGHLDLAFGDFLFGKGQGGEEKKREKEAYPKGAAFFSFD